VKKLLIILLMAALLMAVVAAGAFAQLVGEDASFKLSGEAKTGIFYRQTQQDGAEPVVDDLVLRNVDEGNTGQQGRFRLNMDYDNGNNFGFRARLQWESWNNDYFTKWAYAFGYGNFFEDQMTVSVGKLGGSPWGTGGDMWKELEDNNSGGGMRIEWKPAFIPEEFGKINAGFVLNYFNQDRDQGESETVKITLGELFKESVIGIAYTHDFFMVRLAYRFDSFVDANQSNKIPGDDIGKGEDEMVYRVEESIIREYVPGLRLWALGHLHGLSAVNKDIQVFKNQFYAEFNPPELFGLITPLTAQFCFGNDHGFVGDGILGEIFLKPSFYWHFLSKLITVGTSYKLCFDYGEGGPKGDHPYYYMELEPKVQLNFQSSYIAFAYNFRQEYIHDFSALPGRDPIKQTQWMNLRFCIYF